MLNSNSNTGSYRWLLSLFLVLMSCLGIQAKTYSWTPSEQGYENAEEVSTVNLGEVTISFSKGSGSTTPKYYTSGTALRCYSKNEIVVSSSTRYITSITFVTSSDNPFKASTTGLTSIGSTSSCWEGVTDEHTIVVNAEETSGHVKILSLTITVYENVSYMEYNGNGFYYSNHGDQIEIISIVLNNTNLDFPSYIEDLPVVSIVNSISGNTSITSVTLPDHLLEIKDSLFTCCTALEYVSIPSSVTSIGDNAFKGCTALASIALPTSLESIGAYAFSGCSALESVSIPSSVTSIGDYAFNGCTSLANIRLEDGEGTIELGHGASEGDNRGLFSDCPADIYVGRPMSYDTSSDCGYSPFARGASIKSVELNNGGSTLTTGMFFLCTSLSSFSIPSTVTSIGGSAFERCTALEAMVIPANVDSIGNHAFGYCTALASLTIEASEKALKLGYGASGNNDNGVFYTCSNVDIGRPLNYSVSPFANNASIKSATFGASLTTVPASLFASCTNLTDIICEATTPPRVENENAFTGLYGTAYLSVPSASAMDYAMAPVWCLFNNISYGENTIGTLSDDVFNYKLIHETKEAIVTGPVDDTMVNASIPSRVVYEDGDDAVFYKVTAIGPSAFYTGSSPYNGVKLTSVTLPSTLRTIGERAFANNPISSLTLPESVETVGDYAFYWCTSMRELNILGSVKNIGANAFYYCGLTTINVTGSIENIGDGAFYSNRRLESITLPEGLTSIGAQAFADGYSLNSISLPSTLLSIGDGAFSDCPALESISLPTSLKSIGDNAFANCTALTSIELPYSVNNMGSYVFSDCVKLTDATMPASLVYVPDGTFYGCTRLSNVTLGTQITTIGNSAFENCYNLGSIYIPDFVTTIGDRAFYLKDWRTIKFIDASSSDSYTVTFYDEDGNRIGGSHGVNINDDITGEASPGYAAIPSQFEIKGSYGSSGRVDFYPGAHYSVNGYLTSLPTLDITPKLEYVKMGSAVTTIGANAFNGQCSLRKLELNDKLSSIGASAFYGCQSLETLTIPTSVSSIGSQAFGCNITLSSINIEDSEDTLTGGGCWSESPADLYIGRPLSVLGQGRNEVLRSVTFGPKSNPNVSGFGYCTSLSSVTLSQSQTSIEDYAFQRCYALESITLPGSISSIGYYAFAFVPLSSIKIEESPEYMTINAEAFHSSTALTDAYIGKDCDMSVFASQTGLKQVSFGNNVTTIPGGVFSGNTNLTQVNFGSGLKEICDSAFIGCSGLTDIVIPANVETIGTGAFQSCNVSTVAIGAGIAQLGEKAFDGSNSLTQVAVAAVTPPSANNNTFSYYGSPLYVPEESVDAYYNYPRCWYRFEDRTLVLATDIELDTDGVPDVDQLEAGRQFQLSASVLPSDATLPQIFWRSTNPDFATVDNNGVVTIVDPTALGDVLSDIVMKARPKDSDYAECKIIAETMYADGPVASVTFSGNGQSSVELIPANGANGNSSFSSDRPNDVYNIQGMLLMRDATPEQIRSLAPGLYIIAGKKVYLK